jgi:hypothetical protein
MERRHLIKSAIFCGVAAVAAQPATPSLTQFLTARLAASPGIPPPKYEDLLKIIDTIRTTDANEIRSAMPLLRASLKRCCKPAHRSDLRLLRDLAPC